MDGIFLEVDQVLGTPYLIPLARWLWSAALRAQGTTQQGLQLSHKPIAAQRTARAFVAAERERFWP